jgi:hypothetical protein
MHDPARDRGMIDIDSALGHHLLKVAIAEAIPQIPPYAQHDDLFRKVLSPKPLRPAVLHLLTIPDRNALATLPFSSRPSGASSLRASFRRPAALSPVFFSVAFFAWAPCVSPPSAVSRRGQVGGPSGVMPPFRADLAGVMLPVSAKSCNASNACSARVCANIEPERKSFHKLTPPAPFSTLEGEK